MSIQLTLFGGKGGVGKTTCAAAWGLSRAAAGARVLLLSVDPAHSLADALDRPLRRRVAGAVAPRLAAMELDSADAVARWLKTRRPALARLLDRGTLLDDEDIEQVLSLPVPGLDELAAFITIATLSTRGEYDEVVIDTPPTGHTLRLLETASVVRAFTELLGAMHDRHAMIAEALGGEAGANELVEELREEAAAVDARLHDRIRTQMVWVTLPEPVVVAETIDAIDWLRVRSFPLSSIVVNRLTSAPRATGRSCRECRARATFERASLAPLLTLVRAMKPRVAIRTVGNREQEPRGPRPLRSLGRELTSSQAALPEATRARQGRSVRLEPAASPGGAVVLRLASARLLLFGGKGGVGKTTCATAAALAIAGHDPSRPVRLLSTDPASSLGDALAMPIGDRWTAVPSVGRVEAREIDAAARFDEYRRQYAAAVERFFDDLRGGSSLDAVADRAVFARLFDLAPPGIDELIALVTIVELLVESDDDLVIVDTAPTGHTLRLLSAQSDLRRWLALLMRVLVKYQLASRAERFARDLVDLSRRLRAFSDLLSDPRQARFVTVVRPAALPRAETVRLLKELRALRIAAPTLIVNAATAGTCPDCARRAAGERRQLREIRRTCRGTSACDIIHAPLQLPPPRGPADLLRWSATWRSDGDT